MEQVHEDAINEKDPNSWPGDMLDDFYGDDKLPCLTCLVRAACKRTYNSMCPDRYDYYKIKLEGN